MWAVCSLFCFFLRFRFFFPFLQPPLFMLISLPVFESNHSFYRPSAFLFSFSFRLSCSFRWLVQGPHQTTLPLLETLLQNLANNLRQETPLFRPVDLGRLRVQPQPSVRDSFPLIPCGFLQRRTKGRPSCRLHSDTQFSQQETPKLCTSVSKHRVWHSEGGKKETISSVYFLVLAKIFPQSLVPHFKARATN